MKKCKIIMNPKSGKKKKTNYTALYDILRNHGYDAEIIYTKAAKDATKIVEELPNDIDLVISAGGDGTLNEVVTGDMHRRKMLTLANLPLGTVNDVGNMYGLHQSTLKNLEAILNGVPKKIDVCYINDTVFVYVACLGDYTDMAYATPRDLKKMYGKFGYIMYGLKQFLTNKIHNYNIRYTVNGKTYTDDYSFFFITNSSRIAGVDDVYYDIKLDDNMFEVAMAKIRRKKDMFKLLGMMFTSDIENIPNITYYQTSSIDIEFLNPPKTSWCIDGEEYKSTSTKFSLKVIKGPKMLMPKVNLDRLFNK
ncbi:MAG: diacylglycerol kinase family lipid kinase [Bacilli bacterium]|nr:diacylglycerol kinase family lipid kinase [Bacilli bacterium]